MISATTKTLMIALFVGLTNEGVISRLILLMAQDRYITAVMFLGVWALCLISLFLAAFQPKFRWRLVWAAVIGIASFTGFTYFLVSQSQLTIFDIVSLWAAKADTGRALATYTGPALLALAVTLVGVFSMVLPAKLSPFLERWISRLRFVPALPVIVITGIILWKSGGGTHALPQQFAPAAMGMVVAVKTVTKDLPVRSTLKQTPARAPASRHIVLLVDESIRPDYIDLLPGNPVTPYLASQRKLLVDFGRAASGNNCSHYSNAILRLGAGRNNVIETVTTSPTIWAYAKQAGFRTVFIDAAASHIKNSGALQNFMSTRERGEIDEYLQMKASDSTRLDLALADKIAEISKREQPHFIYANKNGAHFPYDESYPASERRFRPVIADAGQGTRLERKVNSYRNATRWGVDAFFARLIPGADLTNMAIIYTSDHGQNLDSGKITHCSTVQPDAREGLVPLMFLSQNQGLRTRFANSAKFNRNRATHFAIFPTVLALLGYRDSVLNANYGPSLLQELKTVPAFTSGDIFGLFTSDVHWTAIDMHKDYRELPSAVSTAENTSRPRHGK